MGLPLSTHNLSTQSPFVAATRAGPRSDLHGARPRDRPDPLPIPGVPIVWSVGLAIDRIRSTWGWLNSPIVRSIRFTPGSRISTHDRDTPETRRYAHELNLRYRQGRWVVPCPTCGIAAISLVWDGSINNWRCLHADDGCASWTLRRGAHILRAMGELQFGLIIGVASRRLKVRRRQVWRHARNLAFVARRIEDVWALSVAGVLLDIPIHWRLRNGAIWQYDRSLPPAPESRGPIWDEVAPWLMWVVVHEYLMPSAYIQLYFKWLQEKP